MRRLCSLLIIITLAYCQSQCAQGTISSLGVNWGSLASHPVDPQIVMNMLKDNGIKKVKLFDSDSWTVSAFSGTDIEVIVGIPNDQLHKFAHSSKDAEHWVKENVTKHLQDGGVKIKYVAVGNEPFLKSYNGSFVQDTYPAMVNIQKALENAGHGDTVKVSTPLNADVYSSPSNKPSGGQFRDDISGQIKQIASLLNEKNSPFMVNIYPFLSLSQDKSFPEGFAYFDNNSQPISDRDAQYTNVFDANFDTLIYALKRVGFPNLRILVGEVGWPTDGDPRGNANPANAERFYKGLLKKMANKPGSPLHPGAIDMFLFSLFDEDLKSLAPGSFERHWGIFRYDGTPKFRIDFSGQGQDKWPQGAKGVQYQERQWCVVNQGKGDQSSLSNALDYACSNADCTSIGPNCSCSRLDLRGKVSYAFNQFFQARDQDMEVCDFNGLATVVKEDPSRGTCLFPIEIVSDDGEMLKAVRYLGGILGCFLLTFLTFA